MGQQQLLLLILGVLIVGAAIAVGIGQFGAHNIEANREGVTVSLVTISANAFEYRQRLVTSGGGGRSYVGYVVPSKMSSDDYGQYALDGSPTSNFIRINAKSSFDASWVATCIADSAGRTTISYSGW
jgi:hypothetical protein